MKQLSLNINGLTAQQLITLFRFHVFIKPFKKGNLLFGIDKIHTSK